MFPGLQGGPHMHVIAAKAVAFQRGAATRVQGVRGQPSSRNAKALAGALAAEGFRIVSGGTDNHLMLVDLRPFGVTGKVAQEALDRAGITATKRIPFDPRSRSSQRDCASARRRSRPRAWREDRDGEISALIAQVLRKVDDEHIAQEVKAQAAELCSRFVPYPDLV